MHTVVCIKQIIDPEIPPHLFRLDPVTKRQARGRQVLLISDFDAIALEVALQLREKAGGKVTAVTIGEMGEREAKEALHTALAMGADETFLLSDPAFGRPDSLGKARILAAALRKIGDFDLVLCGRQAGDVELGLVGPFLAEEMGLPCATLIANVEPSGDGVRLRRPIEGGYEVLAAPLPLVATVTNDESNVARYASVRGLRRAMRTPVPVWSAADLGLDPATVGPEEARLVLDEVFIPQRESRCEFITGETGEEKARRLLERLRELHLV